MGVKAQNQSGTDQNASGEGSASQGDQKPAQSEGNNSQTQEQGGELDLSKLDQRVQKIIADLRKENADNRRKNKDLSTSHDKLKKGLIEAGLLQSDEQAPEEKLKNISKQFDQAMTENAILSAAFDHGIAKDELKYFKFLLNEELGALKDGDELSEEALEKIAAEAKSKSGKSATSGNTSPNAQAPNPGGSGAVTLEKFVAMNLGERTTLFQKTPELYQQLFAAAKKAGKLI